MEWLRISRPATVLAMVAVAACAPPPAEPPAPALNITELLGGGDAGAFARAIEARSFRFPEDHGPHPAFRTEWWYFTGNLSTGSLSTGEASQNLPGDGRHFGYQLTFFRSALAADVEPRESQWAASQAYMAHFAVSAPAADGGFFSFERFARGAGGLAGAETGPFRVWLEDWSATGGEGIPPIRLRAATQEVAIDLTLAPGKPPVSQGDRGLSRKGHAPGNASYYYSLTRMPSAGTISVGSSAFQLSGLSWMDREWSTSSLDQGVAGWDWFSLQLDDGRDLMVYQLRRQDGSADPLSSGSLVAADGSAVTLAASEYEIQAAGSWRSPASGRIYPAHWRLTVPAERLDLEIEPILANQEINHSFVYWEGAVRFEGSSAGQPVAGLGYVELTGY